MKTLPTPNLATSKGRKALAATLISLAQDPSAEDGVKVGPFTLCGGYSSLTRAAALIARPAQGTPRAPGFPSKNHGIQGLDAMRVYSTPEAALSAIRSQLAIQGDSMEPADAKRCERAAAMIESHIWEIESKKLAELKSALEIDAFHAGTTDPDPAAITPGSTVFITKNFRNYKATVISSKTVKGAAGSQPRVSHKIKFVAVLETIRGLYAFHPVQSRAAANVWNSEIRIPAPAPTLHREKEKQISIKFPGKPAVALIQALESHAFRFSRNSLKCTADYSEERLTTARKFACEAPEPAETVETQPEQEQEPQAMPPTAPQETAAPAPAHRWAMPAF